MRRNLGHLPLTATQATAIANAWLATYRDPTNKIEMMLRAVRDASGNPIPLSHVRADANLYVPELAVRGQRLASGPQPGVNQFYIVETSYRESATGDVRLTLQLDNYASLSLGPGMSLGSAIISPGSPVSFSLGSLDPSSCSLVTYDLSFFDVEYGSMRSAPGMVYGAEVPTPGTLALATLGIAAISRRRGR